MQRYMKSPSNLINVFLLINKIGTHLHIVPTMIRNNNDETMIRQSAWLWMQNDACTQCDERPTEKTIVSSVVHGLELMNQKNEEKKNNKHTQKNELNMRTPKLAQIHTIRHTTFVCNTWAYLVVKCSSMALGAILIPYFLFFSVFFLFLSLVLAAECCYLSGVLPSPRYCRFKFFTPNR